MTVTYPILKNEDEGKQPPHRVYKVKTFIFFFTSCIDTLQIK